MVSFGSSGGQVRGPSSHGCSQRGLRLGYVLVMVDLVRPFHHVVGRFSARDKGVVCHPWCLPPDLVHPGVSGICKGRGSENRVKSMYRNVGVSAKGDSLEFGWFKNMVGGVVDLDHCFYDGWGFGGFEDGRSGGRNGRDEGMWSPWVDVFHWGWWSPGHSAESWGGGGWSWWGVVRLRV